MMTMMLMIYWVYLMSMFVSGIRSQSKPHDIMHEVYRAMKTLGYVSVNTGQTTIMW